MRKPNSANQKPASDRSICSFFAAALLPAVVAMSLAGCSQLQKPTGFNPMPQPKSLSQRKQFPVEQILDRQDEIRLAQQAAVGAESVADVIEEAQEVPAEDLLLESQQQDVVAEAAKRAEAPQAFDMPEAVEAEFKIAQVSFESEIEESESESEPNSNDVKTTQSNVRLVANADDMEGVPTNFARNEIDISTANYLRPSAAMAAETVETASEAVPAPVPTSSRFAFGNSESLALPLQPMLFNPTTRAKKSTLEGTLRPMRTASHDFEAEVQVDKTMDSPVVSQFVNPTVAAVVPAASYNPLTPLRQDSAAIKLASPTVNFDLKSRLLEPINREASEAPQPFVAAKTIEAAPAESDSNVAVEVASFEAAPTFVSEEIIVVDPEPMPAVAVAEAPKATETPESNSFAQPVVDGALADASASYLVPTKTFQATQEAFIPVEVFEDAIVVAEDMQRELTAATIPSESVEKSNEFKIQAVSNTTITSVCAGCGSESCKGCEYDDLDPGEPMFTNNDFATPVTPGSKFVAPMEVLPVVVPTMTPDQMIAASPDFGKPVTLSPPPETDAAAAHVAALPISSVSSLPTATSSRVPPVGISTLMELNAVTWKSKLDEAIEMAEDRVERMNRPSDSSIVNLRLLKAIRNQMKQVDNAPTAGEFSENESQYWQHQLEAITTMLGSPASSGENAALTDFHRHQTAHQTLEHLRSAVAQLESIASLKVNSGQFCTEITGFGQFRPFASSEFSSGQKTLVYLEVENHKTIESQSATGNDFRTRLRGSFAIYDANGKVVQQAEFPTVDDVARKRRRDFYMYMPVTLGDLPPGNYVLHALVEDVYGNKTASLDPPLSFSVK